MSTYLLRLLLALQIPDFLTRSFGHWLRRLDFHLLVLHHGLQLAEHHDEAKGSPFPRRRAVPRSEAMLALFAPFRGFPRGKSRNDHRLITYSCRVSHSLSPSLRVDAADRISPGAQEAIRTEIEQLRDAGSTDGEIAVLVKESSGHALTEADIARYYTPVEDRHSNEH